MEKQIDNHAFGWAPGFPLKFDKCLKKSLDLPFVVKDEWGVKFYIERIFSR